MMGAPECLAWVLACPLALFTQGGVDAPASGSGSVGAGPATVRDGESPFGGVDLRVLENGLRVWIQRLPGDPNVGVSVTLPYGSDADPLGREQLAHFVEHMLFKEHLGRTEIEIDREVADRGGSKNGLTFDDHAAYYVHLPREHTDFAIEWLWKVLSPHAMDPEVVAAEREPIALEIGARRREFSDRVRALFLDPRILRRPQLWSREFGIRTYAERDYDPWRSLHAIQPADLAAFYERYYVPSRMILSVSGDLDSDHVLGVVQRTFGTLPARAAPPPLYRLRDPGRPFQAFDWQRRASVWFRILYKVYDPPMQDVVTSMFIGRFLSERLTELLRRSEDKAVYGLSVGVDQHGPALAFQILAEIRADLYESARATIREEVEALRSGAHAPETFAKLRDSIARQIRTSVTEAADIVDWRNNTLYDPDVFPELPDIYAQTRDMTQARASDFVRRSFVPERTVLDVIYPSPVPGVLEWALGVVLVALTYAVARRLWVRPIDMRGVRYVARLRVAPLVALVAGGVAAVLLALVARLGVWAWGLGYARWVRPIDDYWAQRSVQGLGWVLSTALVLLVLSRVPRKLLLLRDELRIKGLVFRSRVLQPEDIASIELASFREVWLSRRLLRCVPLTLGLFRRQIFIETTTGRSYFVRVRDRDELFELLSEFASQ